MTLEELKAKAYDCIVQIDSWKIELQKVNEKIAAFKPEPKEDKK